MLLTHPFFFVLGILLINSMLGSTLQEINPQPASYDDDFQLALNRSLIITVNDDINDGRVKLSVCKIAIFNLCPIIPGQNVRLNDTVACLLRNADDWDEEATCSILFESIVKNIDEVCSADSFGLCANMTTPKDQPYYYEKLTALTCYAQNYFAEGVECQSYLDQLIVNVIPCALEAGKYCPDVSSDKKMTCLNDTLSHKDNTDFTVGCKSLVGIWSAGYIGATVSPIINITRKHRDKAVTNSFFSDDDASIVWSQAVKVGLAVSLFMILMVIYVLKRICISSHTRMGAPGESIDKISRGLYVRMPSLGEDWEEMDEGEEGWRPEGTSQEK